MTRRHFMRFFLFGGLIGLISRKAGIGQKPKKAMFWKKVKKN